MTNDTLLAYRKLLASEAIGPDFYSQIYCALLRGGASQKDALASIAQVESDVAHGALLRKAILDRSLALRLDENGSVRVCPAEKPVWDSGPCSDGEAIADSIRNGADTIASAISELAEAKNLH